MSDIDFGRGVWRVLADGSLSISAGGVEVVRLALTDDQRRALARDLLRPPR